MTGRQLLVVAGYLEMVVAGLLGGATLIFGPLILGRLVRGVPPSGPGIVAIGGVGEGVLQLQMVELGLYGLLFALGLLLLVSAACARPESVSVFRGARPGLAAGSTRRARRRRPASALPASRRAAAPAQV